MGKKTTDTLVREKQEQRILQISFWSGAGFVIAEFIMTLYSHSQSVLTDTVFDAVELLIIALTMFIVPLFSRPVSEKHPFGYSQLESIFILLKGFMYIAVMITLIGNNVQLMLNGGHRVDHLQISAFEIILTVFSCLILLLLIRLGRGLSSPTADAEIYGWKLDVAGSVGVSAAFFIASFLEQTPLAFIGPYFDQGTAILLTLAMLPEPVRMIRSAMRSIALFSPDEAIIDDIRARTGKVLEGYPFDPVFYDVTMTGRRLWVSIYFTTSHDLISFTELELANAQMLSELQQHYENCFVELIPDVRADPPRPYRRPSS